jgi:glycosyltransferase involved in cell wall biosynthesis
LRSWDRTSSDRVDAFVANSQYIARRVEKTYRRPAHVIYPPVDVDSFALHESKDDFYLAASRMVPYKRIDLIVDAFAQMPNRRLVVIGDGSEYAKIAAKATPNVTLLGYQTNDVLRDHMQRARAFVFAAEEDFGIMPVEAQACGTPVIAYGRGGATESVIEGRTGLFFKQQTAESIRRAVDEFDSVRHRMHLEVMRANADRFSPARFRSELSELVDRLWTRFAVRRRCDIHVARADSPFALDPARTQALPALVRRPSRHATDRTNHAARHRSRATTGVSSVRAAHVPSLATD